MKKGIVGLLVTLMLMSVPLMVVAEDVELRIAWWGSQNRHERTIKVIEMFEEQYPNIKVVYEPSGWGDHWTKLATQIAGGNPPDLIQHYRGGLAEWVDKEQLLPLDQFVEDGTIDTTNISDGAIEGGRFGDKLYGINLGTNSQCFILDADAFKKAEIHLPPQTWTWKDFEELVMQLHGKLGIFGMGYSLVDDSQLTLNAYLIGHGENIYDATGTKLSYSDERLLDYLNMVMRLQKSGAMPAMAEEVERRGQGVESTEIVPGKAAMVYMWSNQVVAVQSAAGEDRNLVLTHVPRPEGGQASNYIKPSMLFTISSASKHPKEAAQFIDFFTNSVEANKILLGERGVPISSVVRKELAPLLGKAQREMFEFLQRVDGDNSPIPPPNAVNHTDIINNVYFPQFIDPVLYGQISPEDGVKMFREMAEEILSE